MDTRYGQVQWGAGQPRRRTSPSNWTKPRQWQRKAAQSGERTFVFCASLADVFDNEVDPAWRHDLFETIKATPDLVWLLLTKRIGNVHRMRPDLPINVAIGATMANQEEYDRDRMKLAAVKRDLMPMFTFGSFEPLLGPIILDKNAPDWIIVGGESGQNARAMSLQWARDIRDQSRDLGRVFNFKQVGGRASDKGGHELDGHTYFDRPIVERLAA
jgi:protein gp37